MGSRTPAMVSQPDQCSRARQRRQRSEYMCSFSQFSMAMMTPPQLTEGADGARSDDATQLKSAVLLWLVDAPQLSAYDKSGHGFYNDATASLICPVEYDWSEAEYMFDFYP